MRNILAERLKQCRKEKGLTQWQAALYPGSPNQIIQPNVVQFRDSILKAAEPLRAAQTIVSRT